MTEHQNYTNGNVTVSLAEFTALITAADTLAGDFMRNVQALLGSAHAFQRPCILYSPTRFQLGEFEELRDSELDEEVCHLFLLPFWDHFHASAIAELLLRKEAETFRSLMKVGLSISAIRQRGSNRDRQEQLFEAMNEFATVAHGKMHLEARA